VAEDARQGETERAVEHEISVLPYFAVIRRASWAHAVGLLVLSLLLVRSLLAVPYLPTNDGPEHVLASHVENHFGDPGTAYADRLRPAAEYAARGFTILYSPLEAWLGWRVGLQVALAVTVLLSAAGFAALVHAVAPPRRSLAFLGFPLALTWGLYMGFFPFAVSSAVGLFVLALATAWREPGGLGRVVLGVALFLQAVCHVFAALLTGFALAALLVGRAPRGARLRELARVAGMGLPAASILLMSALSARTLAATPFAHEFVSVPLATTLGALPRLMAPGPLWRALVVVALVGVAVVLGALKAGRREVDPTDRSLHLGGVALLIASVVVPLSIPGWQFVSPRFIPLGVALCLVALPVERLSRPWVARGVAAGLFAVSAGSLLASSWFHRRLAAPFEDAVRGLSAPVERHGLWLPITLGPEAGLPFDPTVSEVPFLAPFRHFPALYAVAHGGLTPYTFANSAATYPFVVRVDAPPAPPIPSLEKYEPVIDSDAFDADARLRARVLDELATFGMFYEGVLATAARPADVERLRSRGFEQDWASGSVFVGHFVPCRLDVTVPSRGDVPEIDVGVGSQTIYRDEALTATDGPDGARHLILPRAPCGEAWVRPHWSRKATDGTATFAFCRNASATGEIPATLTWGSARVSCEDRPADPR
jgi:hypothetical protein